MYNRFMKDIKLDINLIIGLFCGIVGLFIFNFYGVVSAIGLIFAMRVYVAVQKRESDVKPWLAYIAVLLNTTGIIYTIIYYMGWFR